ncbi:hypothetical protein R69749_08385 [Paraburkholderia domus]|nr:hypothetical protein R69749_08385 [Paraburkholderia domus]
MRKFLGQLTQGVKRPFDSGGLLNEAPRREGGVHSVWTHFSRP